MTYNILTTYPCFIFLIHKIFILWKTKSFWIEMRNRSLKKGQTHGRRSRGIRIPSNQVEKVRAALQRGGFRLICPHCNTSSLKPSFRRPKRSLLDIKLGREPNYRNLMFYCSHCKRWVKAPRDVWNLPFLLYLQ